MKTRKIIYAIMGVALFIATSCSKDSISDQNPATNKANSETTFLEDIESESSSKNGIIFPGPVATRNQEFIDFLKGDWKVVRFTIPESREGKESPVDHIVHMEEDRGNGLIALIEDCPGDIENTMNIYFKARDLRKISSGVRGVLEGTGVFTSRFGGCNLDFVAAANSFGFGLSSTRTNLEKKKNQEIAISIENSLLVIGDFSANEIIVLKKIK
ncbi:hypothetical protein [Aquimarina longa]|uniref:hypothetical protein n=1 Tax=Aquimarina longa TaxID=1080221 RepID=UPI0007837357|nr:hypothetical protein [Aquimarina longa]